MGAFISPKASCALLRARTHKLLQVDIPLVLTLTVPDHPTADAIHSSTSQPEFQSPRAPFLNATRADAAALALTSLLQADTLLGITLPGLGGVLEQSPTQYPAVTDAQVSFGLADSSGGLAAEESPPVDSLGVSLEAFMEATVHELDEALRALPSISPRTGVLSHLLASIASTFLFVQRCSGQRC